MTFGRQFLQGTGIHLPDWMTTCTESTKPVAAKFVKENFTKNATGRVARAQNQNICRHAGNYIPNEPLRCRRSLDISGAIVGSLFFGNGLRCIHGFIRDAEQVPELLTVFGH